LAQSGHQSPRIGAAQKGVEAIPLAANPCCDRTLKIGAQSLALADHITAMAEVLCLPSHFRKTA
jgi:hypothetical protein